MHSIVYGIAFHAWVFVFIIATVFGLPLSFCDKKGENV
jgi:hypothetical protein